MVFAHERARRRGVRRAARARGVRVTAREASYTGQRTAELTQALLTCDDAPTALIFGSDLMAITGTRAAMELGLRVPQDVSIISWDDSTLMTLFDPALTALSRDVLKYGSTVGGVLLDLLDGRDRRLVKEPLSVLQVRGSTGTAS